MNDIAEIMQVMEAAKQIMRQSGNMLQWGEGYPSESAIAADIEKDSGFVIEENGVAVGTFAFVAGPDPTYAQIYEGQWADDTQPYYVIHRIASLATEKGIMKTILDYAFSQTDNIRIDTHRDNVIMRHLMQKHGFSYCGIIYLANGDERLAFQQRIV